MSEAKVRAATALWAGRSAEERAEIGRKISATRKGKPRSREAVAKMTATLRARWASATPEERSAKIVAAKEVAQTATSASSSPACRTARNATPCCQPLPSRAEVHLLGASSAVAQRAGDLR